MTLLDCLYLAALRIQVRDWLYRLQAENISPPHVTIVGGGEQGERLQRRSMRL